jgi:hypothetical protein
MDFVKREYNIGSGDWSGVEGCMVESLPGVGGGGGGGIPKY